MPTESRFVSIDTQAPDFTLPSVAGGDVSLASFRRNKHVVLVFLRGFF